MSDQTNCSFFQLSLCGRGVWCHVCGPVHVRCSGLKRSKDWVPCFTCIKCLDNSSTGLTQQFTSLSLYTNSATTGLTQQLESLILNLGEGMDVKTDMITSQTKMGTNVYYRCIRTRFILSNHLPETTRNSFGNLLTEFFNNVTEERTNDTKWLNFLCAPKLCL